MKKRSRPNAQPATARPIKVPTFVIREPDPAKLPFKTYPVKYKGEIRHVSIPPKQEEQ